MMPAPKMRTTYILLFRQHDVGKDPHRYTVQEGDATMLLIAYFARTKK